MPPKRKALPNDKTFKVSDGNHYDTIVFAASEEQAVAEVRKFWKDRQQHTEDPDAATITGRNLVATRIR